MHDVVAMPSVSIFLHKGFGCIEPVFARELVLSCICGMHMCFSGQDWQGDRNDRDYMMERII